MEKDSLLKGVLEIFEKELEIQAPSTTTNLIDEGYIDSLLFIQLISLLESKYNITISVSDLDIDKFNSIHNITRFLENKLYIDKNTDENSYAQSI